MFDREKSVVVHFDITLSDLFLHRKSIFPVWDIYELNFLLNSMKYLKIRF